MADGTETEDITDLKRYLVEHIDAVEEYLFGKLLT
tara:strand:- start:21117 stop:21221 length:105 start_codon:yes stop_codon:yes gene_type:complete